MGRPGTLTVGVVGALAGVLLTVLGAYVVACLLPDGSLRAEPRGRLRDADVFIAFGLGLGQDAEGRTTAGESNRSIARWLVAANRRRKPTITQEGVYLALKELEASQPDLGVEAWVIRLPHDPHVYVDTHGATLQSWAVLTLKGYHRPVLVSHDLQLQRMVWNFEDIGWGKRIIVPELPAMPFDARSVQHWGTRSRPSWILVEWFYTRPRMGHDVWGWVLLLAGALAGATAALGLRARARRRRT